MDGVSGKRRVVPDLSRDTVERGDRAEWRGMDCRAFVVAL
jgi:hypothetical protein